MTSNPVAPSQNLARVPGLDELRARQSTKWGLPGDDRVAAWIADMDFPPPTPVLEALAEFVAAGDLGYPDTTLADRTREAVAAHLTRRDGHRVDPERIEFLHDAVQGIHLFTLFGSEPGDGVVLTTPLYPPYHAALEEHDRRPVPVPFARQERFELDLDVLDEGLQRWDDPTSRIAVLHVCNPHNPTGRVLERNDLERLAEAALRHDLLVISDEIHADLIYSGRDHIPFASIAPEVADRTVTLTSATKTFNLAAVKLAIVHYGTSALQHRLPSLRSRRFGRPNPFGLLATTTAVNEGSAWLADIRHQLESNRDHLIARLGREAPSVTCLPPEATYLAWISLADTPLADDPAAQLHATTGLVVSDGRAFGPGGEGHVRLNFATPRPVLDVAVNRLVKALDEQQASPQVDAPECLGPHT